MTASSLKRNLLTCLLALAPGLTACTLALPSGVVTSPTAIRTVTASPLPSTPTPTPLPLALTVNGEGISLAEFAGEVNRYQAEQAAAGQTVTLAEARQAVCSELTDELLLAQGAAQNGFVVDEAMLQARLEKLAAQIGGQEALLAWQAAHGYTEADFRAALQRQIAAAWMRDQIAASVPTTAEQVHVRQIFLTSESEAQAVLERLAGGTPFQEIAREYDPLTGGELGWLARGYLIETAIEAAAFSLQPGQYSSIIASSVGFHILYLVERDPARPLSTDALLTLQTKAIQDWLRQQRDSSTILCTPDIMDKK